MSSPCFWGLRGERDVGAADAVCCDAQAVTGDLDSEGSVFCLGRPEDDWPSGRTDRMLESWPLGPRSQSPEADGKFPHQGDAPMSGTCGGRWPCRPDGYGQAHGLESTVDRGPDQGPRVGPEGVCRGGNGQMPSRAGLDQLRDQGPQLHLEHAGGVAVPGEPTGMEPDDLRKNGRWCMAHERQMFGEGGLGMLCHPGTASLIAPDSDSRSKGGMEPTACPFCDAVEGVDGLSLRGPDAQ